MNNYRQLGITNLNTDLPGMASTARKTPASSNRAGLSTDHDNHHNLNQKPMNKTMHVVNEHGYISSQR